MHPDADVRIAPARAEDLDDVRALIEHAHLPPDGLEAHFPDGFVVAWKGPFAVGTAGIEVYGDVGLLRSVAVLEASRGGGLGARLTHAARQLAERAGVRDLYLLTTSADGYFPRLGFRRVAREALPPALAASEQLRGACPATAIAMRLVADGGIDGAG